MNHELVILKYAAVNIFLKLKVILRFHYNFELKLVFFFVIWSTGMEIIPILDYPSML